MSRVNGTLRDTKENGYAACADVKFSYSTDGFRTGSSMSFTTGYHRAESFQSITIFNC